PRMMVTPWGRATRLLRVLTLDPLDDLHQQVDVTVTRDVPRFDPWTVGDPPARWVPPSQLQHSGHRVGQKHPHSVKLGVVGVWIRGTVPVVDDCDVLVAISVEVTVGKHVQQT